MDEKIYVPFKHTVFIYFAVEMLLLGKKLILGYIIELYFIMKKPSDVCMERLN